MGSQQRQHGLINITKSADDDDDDKAVERPVRCELTFQPLLHIRPLSRTPLRCHLKALEGEKSRQGPLARGAGNRTYHHGFDRYISQQDCQ